MFNGINMQFIFKNDNDFIAWNYYSLLRVVKERIKLLETMTSSQMEPNAFLADFNLFCLTDFFFL